MFNPLAFFKTATPHLNRFFHWQRMMRDPKIHFEFSHFVSNYDSRVQNLLRISPASGKPEKVFFFFHGMSGDAGDAAVVYDLAEIANAEIISMGGRGPSWVSDAFLSDAEQIIRAESPSFKEIYLMGISMGACQVLSLIGLLRDDLRKKIEHVFCLMPGSDYTSIYRNSRSSEVRYSLGQSVRGELSLLKERSPSELITRYNPGTSFTIYYQKNDTILPINDLLVFLKKLREKRFDVHEWPDSGCHDFTFKNFDYKRLYYESAKTSTIK